MAENNKSFSRADRVASKVQTLVAEILRDDYSDDPILSAVSLVGAQAHGGLQFVRLFFYFRGAAKAAAQKRLGEITRMVRFELAARMNQRYVPDLQFVYDDTLERAARVDELLAEIDK
jgi:ribosome-binding factor A